MISEREAVIAKAILQEIKATISMGVPSLPPSMQRQHSVKLLDGDVRVIEKALRAYLRRKP